MQSIHHFTILTISCLAMTRYKVEQWFGVCDVVWPFLRILKKYMGILISFKFWLKKPFFKKRVLYYVAKKFKSGKVYIFSFIWTHLNDSVLWILLPSLCLLVSWAAAASIQQSKDDQRENYQDKHSNDGNTTQCPRLLMHTMKEPLHPVLRWPCGFLLV